MDNEDSICYPNIPPEMSVTASETLFDDAPTSAEEEPAELSVLWTPDLVSGLDWRRLTEIMRAMAVNSGFALGPTHLTPAASTDFLMTQGSNGNTASFLVRLAPWNKWVATADCLEDFTKKLAPLKQTRGIYLAPLGFAPSAVHEARKAGIELVDAAMLAQRLEQLPVEHRLFYLDVGTAGDASTPSCPICLKRLERREAPFLQVHDFSQLPDVSYRNSNLIADPIATRRLEVMRDCEVQFVHEVRAQDIIIHGVAIGNFVCDGNLLLNPGASLYGNVAARSVLVRPGAEMHGQTRIIQGTPEPDQSATREWFWRCANGSESEACKKVCLQPH
jgi:hypothetical protein